MGICLDTEQSDGSRAFEEGTETWVQNSPRQQNRNAITPSAGKFPMHNDAPIQFESPKVPVIFVLGGPGSGKVTHCDNLMQEKKEIVHINMSDLLQQYAIGNDIPDYGQLSSKTVTEVLMLEMKMAPHAKTYLVSGYPRNMRDVVEYSEKIEVVNGVILIAWRQKILERQIDYGAKLGQVVLSLAKMELNNFYKNVVPVAEYFDQSHMLISIHGERPPGDVYKDFRSAVFHILGGQENPPEFTNGNAVTLPTTTTSELPTIPTKPMPHAVNLPSDPAKSTSPSRPKTQVISVGGTNPPNFNSPIKPLTYPPVLWVIGGPGSNKAALCTAAAKDTGWTHISLGKLMRAATETSASHHSTDINKLKESIGSGELVPSDIVMKYVENQMAHNVEAKGIILDGFPRDMEQVQEFEAKFRQKPTIILLDCSKLQLGKGRLDDSVTAFRRRLEIFRQSSLPMLKAMDNIGRLTIVDGDTDTAPVQEDFKHVVKEHINYMLSHIGESQQISSAGGNNHIANGHIPVANGHVPNGNVVQNGHIPNGDATLHDLEDAANQDIETISKKVSNNVTNGYANGKAHLVNGVAKLANGVTGVANGNVANHKVPIFTGADNGQRNGEVNYMDGHI
ncbi:adenylate kinase isoenzyme 5 [Sitophilus oryzae]|uniref:Adenylate kinase isoenzyme 5 n=1 Tax=Sitophilus oryzae TaxID=7048 RepID=A0A6J2XEH9_SITOR|nr:adenylate kinase isoenzyme 5 [Sitophilus oryzae]